MSALKNANLALRFGLELALLAALAVAGYRAGGRGWAGGAVALAAVAAAVTVWGLFISPKARVRTGAGVQLVLEGALFALAGGGLVAVGLGRPGVTLLVAAAASRALKAWFDRGEGAAPAG